MYLYHGTAADNLQNFIERGPYASLRHIGRNAFCTSRSFDEAAIFALRKTPASDMAKTGIVLEFDAHRLYPEDYMDVESGNTLRDEQEVRVFTPQFLFLRYYYEYDNGTWIRALPKCESEV